MPAEYFAIAETAVFNLGFKTLHKYENNQKKTDETQPIVRF